MIPVACPTSRWLFEAPAAEPSPRMDWIDRVLGRAAIDRTYRELLLTEPALALTGEPLPAGLMAAICAIEAPDLGEFARRALAAQASAAPTPVRATEPSPIARARLVGAAA